MNASVVSDQSQFIHENHRMKTYPVGAKFVAFEKDLPEKARLIGEAEARQKLVELFFQSVGAAQLRDVVRLFGWGPDLSRRTLNKLVEQGFLIDGLDYSLRTGEWFALVELTSTR